jgi:hypothetical protein
VVAAAAAAVFVLKFSNAPKLPNIPATDPTPDNIREFVLGLVGHPLIWAVTAVTVIWLASWGYLLWDQSRRVRLAALHEAVADEDAAVEDAPVGVVTRRLSANLAEAESDTTYNVEANGHDGNGYGDVEATASGETDSAAPELSAAPNGDGAETGEPAPAEGVESEGEPAIVVKAPAPPARARTTAPRPTAVPGLLERYQPGSIPHAVGYLLANPAVLLTGLGAAVLVYVALYTSMFSNINGIGTGMFGSIGYWLAQQDVRRGDQPWFYYMILIPIYEPLVLLFGFIGIAYFGGRGFRAWRARRSDPPAREPVVAGATANFKVGQPVEFAEIRPFLVLFLTTWFVGAFGLYSWAGEKMPWLTTHIVHPLLFLAALALGQLITSMIRNRRQRAAMYVEPMDEIEEAPPARSTVAARRGVGTRPLGRTVVVQSPSRLFTSPISWLPFWSFLGLFILVSVFWAMAITHRVMNNNYQDWWQLAVFPALLVLLVAAYWSLVGGARVLRYTLVGVLFLLTAYGIRSAIQLSFYHPMTATEMMVYVQTTPDTTRAADTIDRLSIDQTGARDMKVMYDSQSSWPWEWYLRDYKNKQFQPNGPASAPDPSVAVLVLDSAWYDKAKSNQAPQLSNYVGTKYPMRWWFPEDTYRNFIPSTWDELDPAKPKNDDGTPNYAKDSAGKNLKAPVRQFQGALDTIFYTLRTPEEQGKMWKYLIYRQPYAALGSTDMAVFVRKDLVERYNYLASLNLPNYDETMSH